MVEMFQGIRSLFLPAACAGCQHPIDSPGTLPLCPDCFEQLPRSGPPWCSRCGLSLGNSGDGVTLCMECRTTPPSFDMAVSPCNYDGVAKTLIVALKYHAQLRLAQFLGKLMAEAVRQHLGPDPADSIVPIPLYPSRLRERQFNQAELLARVVARNLDLPCRTDLLTRREPTLPQTHLPRAMRFKNVEKAFCLRPNPLILSSRILLVDDVFTTGATVNSCARTLKQGGATRVCVATFARGS